jgi:hypothetical protein
MNHPHPVPQRASRSPHTRRTTQDNPATRQTVREPATRYTVPTQVWDEDDEEAEKHINRTPSSARRYTTTAQRELTPVSQQQPAPPRPQKKRGKQRHPLFYLGLGMAGALLLSILILGPLGSWWSDWRNYTAYGDPRTFQTDAVVGHGDSPAHPSHFLAENLRGEIIVIEFPAGDVSRGRTFLITTLTGPNADRIPVTLAFADLAGDGKPAMLIQFQGQQVVYVNTQGTFRPAPPGESSQSERSNRDA